MKRRSFIVRCIWAACLILAGLNHARILLQHGLFWDYDGSNPVSSAYWTGLTIIDPLVAALLFVRPRIGVPATVVVIATNVVHNLAVSAGFVPYGEYFAYVTSSPQMMSQIGFLLFVIVTWQMAREDVGRVAVLPAGQPG